jgi:hypothetical protein
MEKGTSLISAIIDRDGKRDITDIGNHRQGSPSLLLSRCHANTSRVEVLSDGPVSSPRFFSWPLFFSFSSLHCEIAEHSVGSMDR